MRHPWGIHAFGISIHALREESDVEAIKQLVADFSISIHALREESDGRQCHAGRCRPYFNPRSP